MQSKLKALVMAVQTQEMHVRCLKLAERT